MFCNQCEQTAQDHGCTRMGVCGKPADVAAVQDLLIYATRGLALAIRAAEVKGLDVIGAGRLVNAALFSTITNVNFDKEPLMTLLDKVVAERARLFDAAGSPHFAASTCTIAPSDDEGVLFAQASTACTQHLTDDPDSTSLAQTLLFGLKGVAAYTHHAAVLGHERPELYRSICNGLVCGFDGRTPTLAEWTEAVLDCGRANLMAMELLDAANTGAYGHPEPTEVALRPRPGKAILVTGHDLKDLYDLLVRTEGTGIHIYTHGEMLPAHAYPGLKRFAHLAGHFGTAWQNQAKEFPLFPGAILFTTNCIQRPGDKYTDRVFTTGLVGWPGVAHVENGDFDSVIDCALAQPGFTAETAAMFADTHVVTGFGHQAVLNVADKVIAGVKSGAIKRFLLVGGCDGAKPGRNYYSELVERAPKNSVILTLACGKFRFFDKQLGTINGIPRLLDIGQCNDAYSAVKIAQALADAFACRVNDLPLSIVLSWYEQKAVAVLLSLLALGIRGIRLGPTLPAFLSRAVLQVLAEQFDLKPITTPEQDLKEMFAN